MDDDLFKILEEVDKDLNPMTPYRVLITGSRGLYDQEYINYVLDDILVDKSHHRYDGYKFKHDNIVIVHGAANGADSLADKWAKSRARDRDLSLGQIISIEAHPADWSKHGRGAGPIRNKEMVDTGVNICIAFPHHVDSSIGTYGCMKIAEKAGVKIVDALEEYWPAYSKS